MNNSGMIKVRIECYGAAQNWCGSTALSLDLPAPARVVDALTTLAQCYPEFAQRRERIAVARGDAVVKPEQNLVDGDCLALIPPVSGG